MKHPARAPFVLGIVCAVVSCAIAGCAGSQSSDLQAMTLLPVVGRTPYPYRPQTTPVPKKLGVMTVNLQHRDRPEQLETVANHLRKDPGGTPDFILCQEVMFDRPGLQDSTAEVLADYLGYFVRGTKRTSDREGTAILSRYPIEFYESLQLDSQTSRLLLGFRRVSTMAEINVPGVGRVRLVNVHFTNWGFEKRVRTNQLRETLEWAAARERKVPAAVTFLGGDFNADPTDSEMQLVKDRSVTGPLAFKDFNTTAPSKGPMGDPDRRIDYIFVSAKQGHGVQHGGEALLWKDGVPSKSGTFYLSDHLALVHRYSVTPPPVANIRVPRPTMITGVDVAPVR